MEIVVGYAIVFALLAGPFFYSRWYLRWLAGQRPLDNSFWLPPLVLIGNIILAVVVELWVFQSAEIAGYYDNSKGGFRDSYPVKIPVYAGESFSD